uniref:Uncharacterized protein n=1 Tax=Magallana gigas TaxID=29159 RepID=K1QZU0_MAGGI
MSTNTRVELTFMNQAYQIILLTDMDLDVTSSSENCVSGLEQFAATLTCSRTGGLEPITKVVTFHVLPVNEYPPDVDAVPGIMISEGNVTLPFFIERLLHFFKDRDCPKDNLVLRITEYSSSERDGSQFFIVNSSTGYLYQGKRFDYEETAIQCGLGKGGGNLNITAEDGPHTTSKSLMVTFVDVDDTPPVFVKSECSSTCYTCPVSAIIANVEYAYQAVIDFNFVVHKYTSHFTSWKQKIKLLGELAKANGCNIRFVWMKSEDKVKNNLGSRLELKDSRISCTVVAIIVKIMGTVATDPPSIKALDPDTVPTNITYNMEVYPEKYRDNIRLENGTFVLLQSFANFSGYAEKSDFTVTVTLQGPIPLDLPSIKALDPNTTPSSTITYKMEVNPSKYNGIIKIENGTFGLIQSFANFSESKGKSDFIVTVIVQASGNNGQTLKKCVLTIYVVVRPISSTTQQITERASSSPMKDIVIIVLALVVALLSVILVYAVYRLRVQKKKSEDNVMSYEEGPIITNPPGVKAIDLDTIQPNFRVRLNKLTVYKSKPDKTHLHVYQTSFSAAMTVLA